MCGISLVFPEQSVWMPALYYLLHAPDLTSDRLHQLTYSYMLSDVGRQVHM